MPAILFWRPNDIVRHYKTSQIMMVAGESNPDIAPGDERSARYYSCIWIEEGPTRIESKTFAHEELRHVISRDAYVKGAQNAESPSED